MSEYIDREKLLPKIKYREKAYFRSSTNMFSKVVKEMPTADVQDVQDVKHGSWSKRKVAREENPPFGDFHFGFKCSVCGAILNKTPYYGNCGAKMDGKEDDQC